jgi:hypothetical protein
MIENSVAAFHKAEVILSSRYRRRIDQNPGDHEIPLQVIGVDPEGGYAGQSYLGFEHFCRPPRLAANQG